MWLVYLKCTTLKNQTRHHLPNKVCYEKDKKNMFCLTVGLLIKLMFPLFVIHQIFLVACDFSDHVTENALQKQEKILRYSPR